MGRARKREVLCTIYKMAPACRASGKGERRVEGKKDVTERREAKDGLSNGWILE